MIRLRHLLATIRFNELRLPSTSSLNLSSGKLRGLLHLNHKQDTLHSDTSSNRLFL
jgi:hypothetical protein